MESEKCPEKMRRGSTWHPRTEPCGKPVKRHGLCGVHARKLELRLQREAQWDAEHELNDRMRALLPALRERLAVDVTWDGKWFSFSPLAAQKLLDGS